jgi:acyl carrier protein
MHDSAPLERQLIEIFRDKLHLAVTSSDTDLFETAVLDSLSLVALLLHLENEFGVKVSLADLELGNFQSIARLAKFIACHTAQAGAHDGEQSLPALADHGSSIRHG